MQWEPNESRYNAWRRGDRYQPSQNCHDPPKGGNDSKNPVPYGLGHHKPTDRRGDDISLAHLPPHGRICEKGDRGLIRVHTWHTKPADERA